MTADAPFRPRGGSGMLAGSAMEESRLDEVARTHPLPIADAALNLLCAVTGGPYEQAQRIAELLRATIRWCAGVALAARLGEPRPPGADPPGTRDALETLRKKGALSDGGWRGLARDLLAPWAAAPDEHPVPALVRLFHDARARGKTAARLDALLAFRNTMAHKPPATAAEVQALVTESLPHVAAWLDVLAPAVTAPRIVLPLAEPAEGSAQRAYLLMGSSPARGRWRPAELAPGAVVAPGALQLVDADGRPVLALEPVIRALRPSPEAPEEVYFLDGRGRRGTARYLSLPHGAEREESQVWEVLAAWLGATADPGGDGREALPDEPFRGLDSFDARHARVFFGRERETRELADLVRREAIVTLTGPSGVGKTSLLRAGVGPALERRHAQLAELERGEVGVPGHRVPSRSPPRYAWVIVRPGASPLAALEGAIRTQLADDGPLADDEQPSPNAAAWADRLLRWARALRRVLVLVVDQAEELLTQCADDAERETFAAIVAALGAAADQPARVILSVRGDYFARLAELAPLYRRYDAHVYTLRAPVREDLRRSLTEPVAPYGARFEPGLADEIVEAAGATTGALPLLQFTAARLWERRGTDGTLTRAAYEDLGGLDGALSRYADRVLNELAPQQRAVADGALLALLTAEGTRVVLSEADLRARVGGDPVDTVLETLTRARLLTTRAGARGERLYEVVHERLAESWTRLATLRRAHVADAARRDQLREAAKAWATHDRSRDLLWRGDALAAHRAWAAQTSVGFTVEESAYVEAAERAERRSRRTRRATVSVVLATVGAVAAVATWQWSRASASRADADARRRDAEDSRRGAELEARRARGAQRLAAARRAVEASPTVAAVLLREVEDPDALREWPRLAQEIVHGVRGPAARVVFRGHDGYITDASVSPDGRRVLTRSTHDRTARIWSTDGQGPGVVLLHDAGLTAASFDPSGAHVVTASDDGQARVWQVNGDGPVVLDGHAKAVKDAVFSSDGSLVATTSVDGTVRLWRARDGIGQRVLRSGDDVEDWAVAFSVDGAHVLSCCDKGVARVWRVDGDGTPRVLGHRAHPVWTAAFAPNGQHVVTGAQDGAVQMWPLNGGAEVSFSGDSEWVHSVAFNEDGSLLVTASGGTARVRRTDDASLVAELRHDDVTHASISPRGDRVLTRSSDGTRVWSLEGSQGPVDLRGHAGAIIMTASFAGDGGAVLTAAADATAQLWSVDAGHELTELRGWAALSLGASDGRIAAVSSDGVRVWLGAHVEQLGLDAAGDVHSVAFDRDGTRIAIAYGHDSVRLYRLDGSLERVDLRGHDGPVRQAVFSPDGDRIVTASSDGTARVWAAGSGTELLSLRHAGAVDAASFSPDGTSVLTSSSRGTARLWDLAGRELASFARGERDGDRGLVPASFSPDGTRIVTADGGTIRLWAANGLPETTISAWEAYPAQLSFDDVSFSPDGTQVLAVYFDASAPQWRVQLSNINGVGDPVVLFDARAAAFSPDGRHLATGYVDGTVQLTRAEWDPNPIILRGHRGPVTFVAYTRDGTRVVSGSTDGTVRVWPISASGLRDALWEATWDCLTVEDRQEYLGIDEATARAEIERCEAEVRARAERRAATRGPGRSP